MRFKDYYNTSRVINIDALLVTLIKECEQDVELVEGLSDIFNARYIGLSAIYHTLLLLKKNNKSLTIDSLKTVLDNASIGYEDDIKFDPKNNEEIIKLNKLINVLLTKHTNKLFDDEYNIDNIDVSTKGTAKNIIDKLQELRNNEQVRKLITRMYNSIIDDTSAYHQNQIATII